MSSRCNTSFFIFAKNLEMEKQIRFRGKILNYSIRGSGPAVLLLHGFLESMAIWETMAGSLADRFTVISIDLPGFGKSEVVDKIHSMEMMAGAAAQVLEEENTGQAVVVGHSMGGYVALAFAKKYPGKLNGLVLFHSQVAGDDTEAKLNRNRAIEFVKNSHKNFIASFIPLLFAEENVPKFADEIESLKALAEQTSVEGICAALAGMRDRENQFALLKNLDIPVFFIVGKKDSRVPPEKVLPQLELPKNCEALILDGVGHMGFIEAREITTQALRHFAERMFVE